MRKLLLLYCIYIYYCAGRCPNFCSGHGKCLKDSICDCNQGWGSTYDITEVRHNDCSARVCRYSNNWGTSTTYGIVGHDHNVECSGIGICDRTTGNCKCPKDYTGAACEKRRCPNNCSGHGRCVSMKNLAKLDDAFPLTSLNVSYGSTSLNYTSTWDGEMIYGCVCDSSWEVGLGSNQTQEAEWFGADCSLRHCPSADDPMTSDNELDCYNITAVNGGVGDVGNLCHVDCGNRGVCDYQSGECSCFKNFYGMDCAQHSALADARSSSQDKTFLMDSSSANHFIQEFDD